MPECPCSPDRSDDAGRGICNDAPVRDGEEQPAAPACSCRAWWKVAVVVVLVAAVAGIIASKTHRGASPTQEPDRSDVGPQASSPIQPASEPEVPAEAEMVLATVNGEPITLARLQDVLQTLPDQYRGMFERSKQDLLEELITRKLLLQEVRRVGLMPPGASGDPGELAEADREAVQDMLRREVLDGLDVSAAEVKEFYEQHKDEMPAGRTFEELEDSLCAYALQEKQNEAIETYLAKLRSAATITRNEGWVEAQKALAADNPLDVALKTGRPVVADFGRGTCIPCKMMKPILDELKEEYAGRAEILIIDIDDYAAVTQRCGIRVIPTQIFYDASGREVHRHEGFMPREDIVAKLAEMGAK